MNNAKTTDSTVNLEFSPIRSALWPIHGHEMKKFLPMSFLMFFVLFIYAMLKSLKDPLINYYAVCGGTELVPQLKLWFVMPTAFLLVMVYSALINKFGFIKTFYIMISLFMSFYIIFLTILFPNRAFIHPNAETVRAIQEFLPGVFYWIVPCVTNWSITLFYIFSELWGSIAIASLFWQLAYRVTKKNEVKRFFGLYAIIGNIGLTCSGFTLKTLSSWCKSDGGDDRYIYVSIGLCILVQIATNAMFWYINKIALKGSQDIEVKESKKKEKVKITDGIKMLLHSKYLLFICAIVGCYNIAINLCEVIWKSYMRIYFPNPQDFTEQMATLNMIVGFLTIVASLAGQNILRKAKWKTAALIPVLVLAIFGGAFFMIVLYGNYVSTTIFGFNFVALAVQFGLIQEALSRSIKACLFDATKNIAYLPLDNDVRTKGQAAVEIIGSRMGKASSSAVQTLLTSIISVGSKLTNHLVTIAAILGITVCGWICSVLNLGKRYEEKISEKSTIK